jgi:4-aminobutyrate aminotransferase-like enzyme
MADIDIECQKCGNVVTVSEFADPSAIVCRQCGAKLQKQSASLSKQRPTVKVLTQEEAVAAAAAIKDMEIIVGEKLADNAAQMGQYALRRLQEEFLPFPSVGDVNGLGLMIGIEYVEDKKTKAIPKKVWEISQKIQDRALKDGLFLRVFGSRITLSPPLIVNQKQMDKILAILKPIVAEIPEMA